MSASRLPGLTRTQVAELKKMVSDHATKYPWARKLEQEKINHVFRVNFTGRAADMKARRAVERFIEDHRLRGPWPNLDMGDLERLADAFLGRQEHAVGLRNIINVVRRYSSDTNSYSEGSRRRDLFKAAAADALSLASKLDALDPRAVAHAMGPAFVPMPPLAPSPMLADEHNESGSAERPQSNPPPAPHLSLLPRRLEEYRGFRAKLEVVASALSALSKSTSVPMGRSPLPDPLVFGLEEMAALWIEARNERPRLSFARRGFGTLVIEVFGVTGLGFPETEIRTGLRRVLKAMATGGKGSLPPSE